MLEKLMSSMSSTSSITLANPYLDTAALVFDFAVTNYRQPRRRVMSQSLAIATLAPSGNIPIHAHLFARTVSEVGKLDMGLHFNRWR